MVSEERIGHSLLNAGGNCGETQICGYSWLCGYVVNQIGPKSCAS